MDLRVFGLLFITLLISYNLAAQVSALPVQEPDSVMQKMNEIEEKFKKQVDYYKIRFYKNGRKSKITGIDQGIFSDGRKYLLTISEEKNKSNKKGMTLQSVTYFKYRNYNRDTKKKVFRKTVLNDKLVSARFALPDTTTQVIVNGKYFRSTKDKKIPKRAYINN